MNIRVVCSVTISLWTSSCTSMLRRKKVVITFKFLPLFICFEFDILNWDSDEEILNRLDSLLCEDDSDLGVLLTLIKQSNLKMCVIACKICALYLNTIGLKHLLSNFNIVV